MSNAAFAYDNLVLAATLSAGSPATPASNLATPHVGEKWRSNGIGDYIVADLGAGHSVDTIALMGLSGEDPDIVVKLSDFDPAAGNLHNSGIISGVPYFDPDYGTFVYLLAAPVTGVRYVRIELSEPGVTYQEAGVWFIGTRTSPVRNFQAPWGRAGVRGSVDTIGVTGLTFVDLRQGYWKVSVPFNFLTETERNGFVEDISAGIVANGHVDFLFIKDPASANLSRDCTWGYAEGDITTTQNLYSVPAIYSAEFTVRQRL